MVRLTWFTISAIALTVFMLAIALKPTQLINQIALDVQGTPENFLVNVTIAKQLDRDIRYELRKHRDDKPALNVQQVVIPAGSVGDRAISIPANLAAGKYYLVIYDPADGQTLKSMDFVVE